MNEIEIKNVELVSIHDSSYREWRRKLLSRIITKEKSEIDNRTIFDKITIIFENVVRIWLDNQNITTDKNRVIKYKSWVEKINRYVNRYQEVDVILCEDCKPKTIVEVKSTIRGTHQATKPARKQINKSLGIINLNDKDIGGLLIHINMNKFENCNESVFDEDFSKINIHKMMYDSNIRILSLKAQDVWDYGIKIGYIKTPSLMNEVNTYCEEKLNRNETDINNL